MIHCTIDSSVPEWLIDHPESAAVFERLGIDDSCGGKSLHYVCDQRGLQIDIVFSLLKEAIEQGGGRGN